MMAIRLPPAAIQPLSITDHRVSAQLHIGWADGESSVLPHDWLRHRCRCATCTAIARNPIPDAKRTAPVGLTGIIPVADKGLNLVFSDGHGRGIYPWAYLRELGDERANTTSTCPA